MFGENKNKEQESGDEPYIKTHTMEDDLAGVKEGDDDVATSNDAIKKDSPFFESNNKSENLDSSTAKNLIQEDTDQNNVSFPIGVTNAAVNEGNAGSMASDMANGNSMESGVGTGNNESRSFVWIYVVIILVVLLLGSASYYVWYIKDSKDIVSEDSINAPQKKDSGTANTENSAKDTSTPEIKDESLNQDFSEKTNFLVIKEEELNKNAIKNVINKKLFEMENYSGNLLEFLIVDSNNKPIPFPKFMESFGISLGQNVSQGLTDDFSIFLYKDKDLRRMNIVVGIKDSVALDSALKGEENNLINGLSPIFLDSAVTVSKANFADSNYKDMLVRYANLNKTLDLSIDYALVKNYLMFATNKNSGRVIVDKLLKESEKSAGNGDNLFNE